MRRFVIFLLLFAALMPQAQAAQAAPRCFNVPGIASCIDGRLRSFWEEQGGLAIFGYPLAAQEQSADGRASQRFERARLELHPENPAPYDVQIGRLGVEALAAQGRDWASMPKSSPDTPNYFAETGQAIAPEFWAYWAGHGLEFDGLGGTSMAESVALFGLPITPAQMETSPTDGGTYLTQWYERARFEYHPEHAGSDQLVQLGMLERELRPPQYIPTPGSFVSAQGGQLVLRGEVVRIRGVNYYPQWWPWAEMWRSWNAPQIERELRMARDQLGINTVRILVPYSMTGSNSDNGKITPELLPRLREIIQIIGALDMRAVVTLFDFYSSFVRSSSDRFPRDIAYIDTVVGAFASDDRILAWDIHNEPDQYSTWNDDSAKVVDWLGNMADEIHRVAPNHLVTVGMAQPEHLLVPGADGRRAIDFSDLVSVHIYNAGLTAQQLDAVRAQTDKPMIVEEFGWPTGPQCVAPNYSEQVQAGLYRDIMGPAQSRTSGVIAWTLRDYDAGKTMRWDTREEHFGLYRPDDTLKPAAEIFRADAVPALPSNVDTSLPLTSAGARLPSGSLAPIQIDGTPYHVKSWFRLAWEQLGGETSFGRPLGEAVEDMRGEAVTQYFERGVLVLDLDGGKTPGGAQGDIGKIESALQPQPLSIALRGMAMPAQPIEVAPRFQGFYQQIFGPWRLGAALTGEQVEQVGGVATVVQYFENGRLEWSDQTQSASVSAQGGEALQAQCRAVGAQ
ncbi:cellulase family glycosylhydrolase [Chloroflexia bacterium SDU3-3]|nr:cellulase family glycosylhydrolase [Chloroflexia bacterium SDU3-3]